MKQKKDYGTNELEIVEYPEESIVSTGQYIGKPVLHIKMGKGIKLTNKQLWDYISAEFPGIRSAMFTATDDPMEFAEQIWSFIKYCNTETRYATELKKRWWCILTPGMRFVSKTLYEFDNIIIDVQAPHTGRETPNEFIAWCNEDKNIKGKVEFRIVVGSNAPDINFARMQIPQLGTLRSTITIQPLYWNKGEIKKEYEVANMLQNTKTFEEGLAKPAGWKSYDQFVNEFLDTVRYPYLRILPDLRRVLGLKKIAM